jgi:hypothetical protein
MILRIDARISSMEGSCARRSRSVAGSVEGLGKGACEDVIDVPESRLNALNRRSGLGQESHVSATSATDLSVCFVDDLLCKTSRKELSGAL